MSFIVTHLISLTSFVLTLVFVSSLLRAKRQSGSTLAWLFIILLSPYLGLPLYLLIGTRKLGANSRHKKFWRMKHGPFVEKTIHLQ